MMYVEMAKRSPDPNVRVLLWSGETAADRGGQWVVGLLRVNPRTGERVWEVLNRDHHSRWHFRAVAIWQELPFAPWESTAGALLEQCGHRKPPPKARRRKPRKAECP